MPRVLFRRLLPSVALRTGMLFLSTPHAAILRPHTDCGVFAVAWGDGPRTRARLDGDVLYSAALYEAGPLESEEVSFRLLDDGAVDCVLKAEEASPTPARLPAGPTRDHLEIQARLAELGLRRGFRVWVPRTDRAAVLELMPARAALLPDFPDLTNDPVGNRIAELIDVVFVPALPYQHPELFEVEDSTQVTCGLARINDACYFRRDARGFIVGEEAKRTKYEGEMRRPTFRDLRGIITFQSFDEVRRNARPPQMLPSATRVLPQNN